MKPALFLGLFPPPPAGAWFLPWLNGPGAGGTANADKTLVVQLVVRHLVLLQVGEHLVEGPVDDRVEFDKLEIIVPFQQVEAASVGALAGTQTGYPDIHSPQRARQRQYFSDMAAGFAVSAGFADWIFIADTGQPQLIQATALSEISLPHSGHLIKAIFIPPTFCLFAKGIIAQSASLLQPKSIRFNARTPGFKNRGVFLSAVT